MIYYEKTLPYRSELVFHDDRKGKPQSIEAIWFNQSGQQEFEGFGATEEEARAELVKEITQAADYLRAARDVAAVCTGKRH